jgi:hypothetical protein
LANTASDPTPANVKVLVVSHATLSAYNSMLNGAISNTSGSSIKVIETGLSTAPPTASASCFNVYNISTLNLVSCQ